MAELVNDLPPPQLLPELVLKLVDDLRLELAWV